MKFSDPNTTCPGCHSDHSDVSAHLILCPARHIGRFARSIETGWRGCVVAAETYNGEVMLKMKCGTRHDNLEDDDVRWFAPADLRFLPS